jgi:hypothetical protein
VRGLTAQAPSHPSAVHILWDCDVDSDGNVVYDCHLNRVGHLISHRYVFVYRYI